MMKKAFYLLLIATGIFVSCQDTTAPITTDQAHIDMSDFYVHTDSTQQRPSGKDKGKNCQSMTVLNRQLQENPGLYKAMYDIEYNSRKFINSKKPTGVGGGGGGSDGGGGDTTPIDDGLGLLNVPVYVHVVYSNANENISSTQIASQISILNADFRKTNPDITLIPTEFAGDATDSQINFTLAQTFRFSDATASWGTRDAVKLAYPPVTPETHLNIWVCNIGGGILGYAQFPGGNLATDGVVVGPQYFGNTGYVAAPFDGGRTLTHEVGHYFNLRHIWGDGRCRQDDFVTDTPSSDGPNFGCPSYPTVNCRTNDMTMNYMDYVNDDCMYMFSEGQKQRMRAVFASGGPRANLIGG